MTEIENEFRRNANERDPLDQRPKSNLDARWDVCEGCGMTALKDFAIVLAIVAACSFLTGVAVEWIYPELERMSK